MFLLLSVTNGEYKNMGSLNKLPPWLSECGAACKECMIMFRSVPGNF